MESNPIHSKGWRDARGGFGALPLPFLFLKKGQGGRGIGWGRVVAATFNRRPRPRQKENLPHVGQKTCFDKKFEVWKCRLTNVTTGLPSAPPKIMHHLTRFCLILFILAIVAPVFGHGAEKSLYDSKTARKIDPALQSVLGPESSKFRYDNRMIKAAEIAAARARQHSTKRCWRYVKDALLAADMVDSRPTTVYAKQAASELTGNHGFTKIREKNPYKAPLGAVLVYGGRGAGHVEIRTAKGFVSDFVSAKPSSRPLIGIYIKKRA
jgi:hypothetical protein